MEQTAVEFAVKQLEQLIPFGHQLAVRIILEQSKEMEKQQIIDAYNENENYMCDGTEAEQYYNGKFKNK